VTGISLYGCGWLSLAFSEKNILKIMVCTFRKQEGWVFYIGFNHFKLIAIDPSCYISKV
jgi:hypothetical protein